MGFTADFSKVWEKVWDMHLKASNHNNPWRDFMKKRLCWAFALILILIGFSGCNAIGEKTASQSIIYGATAILSLLLLIGCCILVRQKRGWFILLFSSILLVNTGYTVLSVSSLFWIGIFALCHADDHS